MFMNYINKFQNKGWSKNSIYMQIKNENPSLSEEELLKKSALIYKELNRLNQQTRRSDRSFYENNILAGDIPFTYFSQNKKDKLNIKSTV